MPPFAHPLDAVRVASPCKADWDAMQGDDRQRFCGQCEKHVYNLSAMTRAEAEDFVEVAEGKKCIRFFRREDGTILTQDCPEGRVVTATGVRTGARFAALFGLLAGAAALVKLGTGSAPGVPAVAPVAFVAPPPVPPPFVAPARPMAVMGGMPPPRPMMGDMAAPVRPPRPPAPPKEFKGKMIAPVMGEEE
jgi:hypothetical protein